PKDPDDNWTDVNDEDTTPIAGGTMQLIDSTGKAIDTTTTDKDGFYHFMNLVPGTYAVREIQPAGYLEGDQHAGSGGGDAASTLDVIQSVPIHSGDALVDYDFCETLPVSIAGIVWIDTIRNCEIDESEARLG